MALRANRPHIPYQAMFNGPLRPGFKLYISGTPVSNVKFDIYLTQGFSKQKIAFLLNPRFNEQAVVRNTKDGKWGKEEKHGGFPFRVGEAFRIEISAGHDSFRVEVNGHYFCDYKYRLPLAAITALEIENDVMIQDVHTTQ